MSLAPRHRAGAGSPAPQKTAPGLRADGFRHTSIVQGERGVSDDPQVLFSTILGSCIAACLFDPDAKVGGMNHFLLGEPQPGQVVDAAAEHRYGVHAMELLINDMLRRGARRERIRAHLYGGANLNPGMRPIGTDNAAFAVRFLEQDGIPLLVQDLGGRSARRLEFLAAQGRSRVRIVRDAAVAAPPPRRPPPPLAVDSGDLDLF